MSRVAVYSRVSTHDQDPGLQVADLREYCARAKHMISGEYTDVGVSGAIEKRPELDRLMTDARKRLFDIVLVWRFDRFARSTRHLVNALDEFRSLGIGFVSYQESIDTASPMGEAMFAIIAAMAQLERDIIRERVLAGMRRAKELGKRIGRPAVEVDFDRVVNLRNQGLSLRKIALELGTSAAKISRILTGVSKGLSAEPS